MKRKPPEPFYGPDDYYDGMDVEQATKENEEAIALWWKQYKSLSTSDKIRLWLSDSGCEVTIKCRT
jgi:hypothetical protein